MTALLVIVALSCTAGLTTAALTAELKDDDTDTLIPDLQPRKAHPMLALALFIITALLLIAVADSYTRPRGYAASEDPKPLPPVDLGPAPGAEVTADTTIRFEV